MRLFTDPTPRIERTDTTCAFGVIMGRSATSVGTAGYVSFLGRTYSCTVVGNAIPGQRGHFIQTRAGGVWAIPASSIYRSSFGRPTEEWTKKASASLALIQLLKRNPRRVLFTQGVVVSASGSNAVVLINGKQTPMKSMFLGAPMDVPDWAVGKTGLVYTDDMDRHLVCPGEGPLFSSYNAASTDGGILYGDLYSGDAGNRGIRVIRKAGAPVVTRIETGFAVNVVTGYDPAAAADAVISSIVSNVGIQVSLLSRDSVAWWGFGTHVSNRISIVLAPVEQPSVIEITMPQSHYCRFTRSGSPVESDEFKLEGFNVSTFDPSLTLY